MRRFLKWQFASPSGWLVNLWVGAPLLAILWDVLVLRLAFGGIGTWRRDFETSFLRIRLFPDGVHVLQATGLFWLWLAIWVGISAGLVARMIYTAREQYAEKAEQEELDRAFAASRSRPVPSPASRDLLRLATKDWAEAEPEPVAEEPPAPKVPWWTKSYLPYIITSAVTALVLLLTTVMFWRANQGNDRDLGQFEAKSGQVTWFSPTLDPNDPNTGASAVKLLQRSVPANGRDGCDRFAKDGIYGCIKQGVLPDDTWYPRSVSLAGAEKFMTAAAGGLSNVELLKPTLAYVYNEDGTGHWNGILGSKGGKLTPDYGVTEWDGKDAPSVCSFHDGYRFNRALQGSTKNSLSNLVSDKFPGTFWELRDVSGWCDGDKPVFAMPMTKPVAYKSRTAIVAAGVLIIKGSPNGDPVFDFRKDVEPGAFPVPVYPESLVTQQTIDLQWVNGRRYKDQGKIGYSPTTADAQTGNDSNYLLEGDDGEDWVSPLTPKESGNQLFVAYAKVRANSIHAGTLNQMLVYLLAKNDPRIINLDRLEAPVRATISQIDPGFFSSGGELKEYLPTKGGKWQVYGEISGQPRYRILTWIDASNQQVRVTITKVSNNEQVSVDDQSSGASTSTNSCKPQMTETERAQCLAGIAGQIARGSQPTNPANPNPTTSTNPSPSASATR
jgi:hypothetical protein